MNSQEKETAIAIAWKKYQLQKEPIDKILEETINNAEKEYKSIRIPALRKCKKIKEEAFEKRNALLAPLLDAFHKRKREIEENKEAKK